MSYLMVDGFEHQVTSSNKFVAGIEGTWDNAAYTAGWTFPSGRTGYGLQLVYPGTATCFGAKYFTNSSVLVGSLYFKLVATPGTNDDTRFVEIWGTYGADYKAFFFINNSTGAIRAAVGTTTPQQTGPNVDDATYHRLDFKLNLSANPWTLDWQVDGSAQTQCTWSAAATTCGSLYLGTRMSSDTLTVLFDDLVMTDDAGDYPIGEHYVYAVVPTADYSYAQCSTVIEDNNGNDIDGTPTAFDLVDEWPPNTSDYVQQSAIGAGNYVDISFADTEQTDILAVMGYMGGFGSGTTAQAHGITRIVDSGGSTLTDIFDGDMSETSLHYRSRIIAAPGGSWTQANFNGVRVRLGFCANATRLPYWSAVMLQYAAGTPPSGASTADPFGMSGFFGA